MAALLIKAVRVCKAQTADVLAPIRWTRATAALPFVRRLRAPGEKALRTLLSKRLLLAELPAGALGAPQGPLQSG